MSFNIDKIECSNRKDKKHLTELLYNDIKNYDCHTYIPGKCFNNNEIMYVAHIKNEILGFITSIFIKDKDNNIISQDIILFGTKAGKCTEYKGIGRKLTKFIIDDVKKDKHIKFLWVNTGIKPIFYVKMGFKKIGTTLNYVYNLKNKNPTFSELKQHDFYSDKYNPLYSFGDNSDFMYEMYGSYENAKNAIIDYNNTTFKFTRSNFLIFTDDNIRCSNIYDKKYYTQDPIIFLYKDYINNKIKLDNHDNRMIKNIINKKYTDLDYIFVKSSLTNKYIALQYMIIKNKSYNGIFINILHDNFIYFLLGILQYYFKDKIDFIVMNLHQYYYYDPYIFRFKKIGITDFFIYNFKDKFPLIEDLQNAAKLFNLSENLQNPLRYKTKNKLPLLYTGSHYYNTKKYTYLYK